MSNMKDILPESGNLMDAASVAVVLGAFANILPPIAAALAIIWTAIRIYDRIVHGVSK